MSISSIEKPIGFPIEQRNTGKGNPNAVLTFDVELNNRQKKILEALPDYNSRVTVKKNNVNMKDLAALTAVTGDEFAMFTKGNERLIIRGNEYMVDVTVELAEEMNKNGFKWSGHTHPGNTLFCLNASDGDSKILAHFKQDISSIYNSKGQYTIFGKE
ncbi:MAG: hypothetical protein ACI4GY_09390 [Acutalibacteraceae bacterium]